MSMLKEAFAAGKFGVTAEMAPPKGYDFSEQLEAARLLNGKVHGVKCFYILEDGSIEEDSYEE